MKTNNQSNDKTIRVGYVVNSAASLPRVEEELNKPRLSTLIKHKAVPMGLFAKRPL